MDPLELRTRVELPPEPRSARTARKLVGDICNAAQLGEEACATAALLTSELVTNAIRYGGSSFVLEAATPAGVLRISVADRNPNLPGIGTAVDCSWSRLSLHAGESRRCPMEWRKQSGSNSTSRPPPKPSLTAAERALLPFSVRNPVHRPAR